MSKFDDSINELIQEYFQVEQAIKNCRITKETCNREIQTASKYIGEIKAEIIELMSQEGVLQTRTPNFVVSKRKTQGKLLVDKNVKLPSEYIVTIEEPNKKKLLEALKAGNQINGVSKEESKETIQIKRI